MHEATQVGPLKLFACERCPSGVWTFPVSQTCSHSLCPFCGAILSEWPLASKALDDPKPFASWSQPQVAHLVKENQKGDHPDEGP